ncbi:MAG: hypothetical protein JRN15_15965 [Nitrososphaerota archaeon]|nr:hypothetical protein [Nitrososphaerota archaeon]
MSISATSVGVGLSTFYLAFLGRVIALSDWSRTSEIPLLIFITLAIRLAVVIILAKYINRQPVVAYILLSFEVFLIPAFALLEAWTSYPEYTALMSVVLTSWIGASAIIVSPYAIYEFAKGMTKTRSLLGVIAIGTFELAGMLFLVSVVQESKGAIAGPGALGEVIIQPAGYSLGSTTLTSVSSFAMAAALVVFFVASIAYITLGRVSHLLSVGLSKSFLIPLGGIVASLVWVLTFSFITSNVLLAFTVPALIGTAGMWVITRGK